jgi:hypothetical protein
MANRQDKLGIKQTIQREWMDRVVQMVLAGMAENEIRADLDAYLSTQKQSGGFGERGKKTYGLAIGILASWFSPDIALIPLRDDALKLARNMSPKEWLPLHWAIISASYPFWFNVAKQVGRLLNLQDQITQAQVFGRLTEQYGDRETVSRNARYTVRSFVAWGVLKDSKAKGCYEQAETLLIEDRSLAVLLLEAELHATTEGKGSIGLLLNTPAFFPFSLPIINGVIAAQQSPRIDVARYGLDEEMLRLK